MDELLKELKCLDKAYRMGVLSGGERYARCVDLCVKCHKRLPDEYDTFVSKVKAVFEDFEPLERSVIGQIAEQTPDTSMPL